MGPESWVVVKCACAHRSAERLLRYQTLGGPYTESTLRIVPPCGTTLRLCASVWEEAGKLVAWGKASLLWACLSIYKMG